MTCLTIANGSLEETRYFLILSRDLKYLPAVDSERLDQQSEAIGPMLGALVRSLRNRHARLHGSRVAGHGSRTTSARS